jgi:sugar phosphate permease
VVAAPPPGPPKAVWTVAGVEALSRTAGGTAVFGFMPVVPMVIVSALLMVVVSKLTRGPSAATIKRYFPGSERKTVEPGTAVTSLEAPVS